MNPAFLVVRPGKAFGVEPQSPQEVRATVGAIVEGCYIDTRWYDANGGVWSVVEATLSKPASLLDRALQRPVPVALRFGPRAESELADALSRLRCSEAITIFARA